METTERNPYSSRHVFTKLYYDGKIQKNGPDLVSDVKSPGDAKNLSAWYNKKQDKILKHA